MVGELEFPLETAGGEAAMEEGALLLLALLLAANGERVLLRLEVQVVRAEPRDLCVPKIRFGVDAAGGRRKLAS
jgi:hypothetical protein